MLTRREIETIKAGDRNGHLFAFHFTSRPALENYLRGEEFTGNCFALHPDVPSEPREFREIVRRHVGSVVGHTFPSFVAEKKPSELTERDAPGVLAVRIGRNEIQPIQFPKTLACKDFHLFSDAQWRQIAKVPERLKREGPASVEQLKERLPLMHGKVIKVPLPALRKMLAEVLRNENEENRGFRTSLLKQKLADWFTDALIKHWKENAGR
ncbi:MAG: hypothetical protein AB1626_02850 [Candidatus Micrarchaeota archaeon]